MTIAAQRVLSESIGQDGAPGSIPRIIHQVYLQGELTPALRENVAQIKAANPGWEHRLYSALQAERLILDRFGATALGYYRRINPAYGAARCDFFRYFLMHAIGGVYLDIKSRFARPLDEIISGDEQFVLSHWSNRPGEPYAGFGLHAELAPERGEYQTFHIIAAPGHPFLAAVIERVKANIDRYRPWREGVGRNGVLRVTGPIAYTHAIAPLVDLHPCTVVRDERDISAQISIPGSYSHQDNFKNPHYSKLTSPVVELPLWAMPLARLYGLAARVRARQG